MLRNIVIVSDWCYVYGGASDVAINSAVALTNDYNVYFFSAIAPIDHRLIDAGVQVVCLGKKDILNDPNRLRATIKGLFDISSYKIFYKLLKTVDRRETIVHFHTWTNGLSSSLFYATKKLNFAVVITMHDYFIFCPNGGLFNFKKNIICDKRPMSIACMRCNCDYRSYPQKIWRCLRQYIQNKLIWKNRHLTIIAISTITYDICSAFLKQKINVKLIADPLSLEIREPRTLNVNGYYIYIGRLTPIKGPELFCRALSEMHLKGVVLGDGYLFDELKNKYPDITFVGWKSGKEKEQFIRGSKALIFPSVGYETFGLAVAEAKTYGIPCIVPKQSAANEQIQEGMSGYTFDTGSLRSLKDAIKKYEEADILKMQKYIIDHFDLDSYTIESHVQSLKILYNNILDKLN